MIPYVSMSVYRLMQLTITVVVIHFELVGFHERVFPSCASMLLDCGRPYRAIGSPTERQDKHTIFYLQFQRFLTKHR